MKTAQDRDTLMSVSDGLSHLPRVHLVAIRPHPHAAHSFLADVTVEDTGVRFELRALAERVYVETGSLIMFREIGAPAD